MKRAMLVVSALLTLAWVTLRALGFWRYAAVLSGTLPDGANSLAECTPRAVLLLVVHFAFVLFAAPLALSALVLHGLDVLREKRAQS